MAKITKSEIIKTLSYLLSAYCGYRGEYTLVEDEVAYRAKIIIENLKEGEKIEDK